MANRTIEINGGAATFLWESYATQCDWSSLLRELTQNSIDAGAKNVEIGALLPKEIYGSDAQAPKLFVFDDGSGFEPTKMEDQLISLFTSGREQGHKKNFGIGAKLVMFGLSPHGGEYWTRSSAHPHSVFRVRLAIVDGQPSLVDLDNMGSTIQKLDARHAPGPLAKTVHGTLVIVNGVSPEHDTTAPPEGFAGGRRWVSRALNRRYFRFPEGVQVKSSMEDDVYGTKRPIPVKSGAEILDSYNPSTRYGSVKVVVKDHLGGPVAATVHWYLIHEKGKYPDSHGREERGEIFSLLFQNECHAARYGSAARSALSRFGVSYSSNRVVIHVEPDEQCEPNKSRTNLERGGHSLDITLIGAQFKAKLPDELVKAEQLAQRRFLQEGGNSHWLQKFRALLPYLTPTFRKDCHGTNSMETDQFGTVDRPGTGPEREHSTKAEHSAPRPTPSRQGTIPGSARGHDTRSTGFQLPNVNWKKSSEMDDAAHIVEWVPTRREILVNAEHREVVAATEFWKEKVVDGELAATILATESRDLWNIQLIEKIINLERLLDGSDLDQDAFSLALGTVFCQRVVTDSVLKQAIPQKYRCRTW